MDRSIAIPVQPSRSSRWKVWLKRSAKAIGVLLVVAVVAAITMFVMFYFRAIEIETYRQVLERLESGKAYKDEDATFRARADAAAARPSVSVQPGLYIASITRDAIVYDVAIRLSTDGKYEHRLAIGNQRMHKNYFMTGTWLVRGEVLHVSYAGGDAFLIPPAARLPGAFEREIITQIDPAVDTITLESSSGGSVTLRRMKDEVK